MHWGGSSSSSYFAPSEFEGKVSVNDNLTTDLRDSPINLSTLLDAIGRGEATPKKSGKSREPINEVSLFFVGGLLYAVGLRVAPSMLSEEEEFFARHLPHWFVEKFV